MLTDQPAHVLAVRSGLTAKARRVGCVTNRQLASVEDLATMEIGERHFGRGNQKEIPLSVDLEEVRFELWQISCTGQRRTIHEERRFDFQIAMLLRMKVEHEVDQGALETRACAAQHRKSRARNFGG